MVTTAGPSYPCAAQCPWAKVPCFVDSLWHAKCQRVGRAVKAQGTPSLGGTGAFALAISSLWNA